MSETATAGGSAMVRRIGGFRIIERLKSGSGGQGFVLSAVCESASAGFAEPGRKVALKIMPVDTDDSPEAVDRAWRRVERRTAELRKIDHPNIVRYLGCFRGSSPDVNLGGEVFAVVQELLEGESLRDIMQRTHGGLDADKAIAYAKAASDGLAAAAAAGITHRDVKPGNVFVCADGAVKVIDFEIAGLERRSGSTASTATGTARGGGTYKYMAPERQYGSFRPDECSDVFSLGVMLHEMLSGRPPYAKTVRGDEGVDESIAFFRRWSGHDGASPIDVSSRIPAVLDGAAQVILTALAPDRQMRYKTFAEFRAALDTIRFRHVRNRDYTLLKFVGKGGFGVVYKAMSRSGDVVALKMQAKDMQRFRREATSMRDLRGEGFVKYREFFEEGDKAVLVMDFLEGMPGATLRDAIKTARQDRRGGRLPVPAVFAAFMEYATGLSLMHGKGYFHRDIKPSNLYFPSWKPENAVIMDLGVVRDLADPTPSGKLLGTYDYLPPELALGQSKSDARGDIYALGLCFYEALAGVPAYRPLPRDAHDAVKEYSRRAAAGETPDFDASPVAENPDLLKLLRDMTNPDPKQRIADAETVKLRIARLARKWFYSANSSTDATTRGTRDRKTDSTTGSVSLPKSRTGGRRKTHAGGCLLAALLAACGLFAMLNRDLIEEGFGRIYGLLSPEKQNRAVNANNGDGAGTKSQSGNSNKQDEKAPDSSQIAQNQNPQESGVDVGSENSQPSTSTSAPQRWTVKNESGQRVRIGDATIGNGGSLEISQEGSAPKTITPKIELGGKLYEANKEIELDPKVTSLTIKAKMFPAVLKVKEDEKGWTGLKIQLGDNDFNPGDEITYKTDTNVNYSVKKDEHQFGVDKYQLCIRDAKLSCGKLEEIKPPAGWNWQLTEEYFMTKGKHDKAADTLTNLVLKTGSASKRLDDLDKAKKIVDDAKTNKLFNSVEVDFWYKTIEEGKKRIVVDVVNSKSQRTIEVSCGDYILCSAPTNGLDVTKYKDCEFEFSMEGYESIKSEKIEKDAVFELKEEGGKFELITNGVVKGNATPCSRVITIKEVPKGVGYRVDGVNQDNPKSITPKYTTNDGWGRMITFFKDGHAEITKTFQCAPSTNNLDLSEKLPKLGDWQEKRNDTSFMLKRPTGVNKNVKCYLDLEQKGMREVTEDGYGVKGESLNFVLAKDGGKKWCRKSGRFSPINGTAILDANWFKVDKPDTDWNTNEYLVLYEAAKMPKEEELDPVKLEKFLKFIDKQQYNKKFYEALLPKEDKEEIDKLTEWMKIIHDYYSMFGNHNDYNDAKKVPAGWYKWLSVVERFNEIKNNNRWPSSWAKKSAEKACNNLAGILYLMSNDRDNTDESFNKKAKDQLKILNNLAENMGIEIKNRH